MTLIYLICRQVSRQLVSVIPSTFRGGCLSTPLMGGISTTWFPRKRRQGAFSSE